MVFIADDLGAWLVALVADAARKRLITWVLGSDQERALRQAANAAVQQTLDQFSPAGDEQRARQLTTAIKKALEQPELAAPRTGQMTLLETLQASVAAQLAALDTSLTGVGQPAADVRGVSAAELADSLVSHLMREIVFRGSRGGPLAPLADQLNHDLTHLRGQRVESKVDRLLDEVQDALTRAGGGPAAPRKPVRLPPRPVFLAGREELLAELGTRLSAGDDPGPRLVALCGLGGAGKTSVALEYAYRHLAEVEVAWQLAAEDATVLAAGFGELAAQLGTQGLADARDPVASVHAVLARFAAPWLLIFDNAADPASVAAFLPPAGPGRVLITSQNPHWPGQAMAVPVLDSDAAAGFLISRTGDQDPTAARDLAGALGGLPLALEQAAAYTQASGMTLARYLSVFRGRAADLLDRGQATGHPASVAKTLRLALSRLGDEAPPAAGLLQLLACLAPEPVPLALLLSDARIAGELAPDVAATAGQLLGDPLAAGDAIAALRQYSLVIPAGDGLVLVHRLVQAVTLTQASADVVGRWKRAAAALVEAAVPADPAVPAAWRACAVLLPHARAVLDLTSAALWRIAQYLGDSGSYPASRDLFRLIADAYRDDDAYGPEHPRTLAARNNLASATFQAGDAVAARDQYSALVPVMERVLGPEHPETLNVRNNLASATMEAGEAVAARDQYSALVPVMERVLGAEHPDALKARNNLASATLAAGDAAASRGLLAELVPVMERVLGAEHPDTLKARNNLASATMKTGDAAAARDQYTALVPVMERVLGPEHPDTLNARSNLASATLAAGDAAAARDQYTAILPLISQVVGPEHPQTLNARNNLAQAILETGDAAAARGPLAELVPVMEQVLGAEHPDTLNARSNLAQATLKTGDAAAARGQYTALVPVMEQALGPEHPTTLGARNNLASATLETGAAAAARGQYTALVPVMEQALGPEHPTTLSARNNLASATLKTGAAAAARDLLAELVPVMERVLGAEHPDTLNARSNLAQATLKTGDAAGARDQYTALVPVMERVLGPEHPMTLGTRNNVASATRETGDAAAARDLLAGLVPVMERVLGPEHPTTLGTRNNLAQTTGEAGDAAAARDLFAELVPVMEGVLGSEHPKTLDARLSLALWIGFAGNAARASHQLRTLLPIFIRTFGTKDPNTNAVRKSMAYWNNRATGGTIRGRNTRRRN